MRPQSVWILLDKRGRPWRFDNDQVVIYPTRRDAVFDKLALDPRRGWRATRATLTVGVSGE